MAGSDEFLVQAFPVHVHIGDCPAVSILVEWFHTDGPKEDEI